MRFLVIGAGKTGGIVAEVARERGHQVRVLDLDENQNGSALTAAFLADYDAAIDFTTPEAAAANIRAVLSVGGKIVVGTTGWYQHLDEFRALVSKRLGSLLYATNFSIGVLKLFRLTRELARLEGYKFSITETHHTTKLDAPSGTAITLRQIIELAHPGAEVEITSLREGDARGTHIVRAESEADYLEVKHEAHSRRGFAEGAVRAAEWITANTGCWEFREIADQL
jgi:4-hydroxy-tetrahydrodipicolinate reductase